jgi:hypothetical protein
MKGHESLLAIHGSQQTVVFGAVSTTAPAYHNHESLIAKDRQGFVMSLTGSLRRNTLYEIQKMQCLQDVPVAAGSLTKDAFYSYYQFCIEGLIHSLKLLVVFVQIRVLPIKRERAYLKSWSKWV